MTDTIRIPCEGILGRVLLSKAKSDVIGVKVTVLRDKSRGVIGNRCSTYNLESNSLACVSRVTGLFL